jgi:hypothetical protein
MRKLPYILFTTLLVLFLVFLAQRFDLGSAFFPQREVTHIKLNGVVEKIDLQGASQPVSVPSVAAPMQTHSDRIAPPEANVLRAEAEKNPHETPPSLLAFAHSVAVRETEAKKSPEQATAFFSDLSDCATGNNVPQAQALCLVTAAEVANTYPDILKSRYEALADMTPPEARKLVRQMHALAH